MNYAFRGIQACVVYLILSAGFKMLKGLKKDAVSIAILCTVLVALILLSIFAVDFSTIIFILISGVVGLAVYFIRISRARKGGEK